MNRLIIILAHATDAGAASVAQDLRRELGPLRVRVVHPEMLSLAAWSHRVDARGCSSTRVALPGAEPVHSAEIGAVLNRIRYLPVPAFGRAAPKDQEYAGAELQALVASWLAGLGDRVVHVVRRHPWLTPMLPLQHWAAAAARSGLPVLSRAVSNSARPRPEGVHGGRPTSVGTSIGASIGTSVASVGTSVGASVGASIGTALVAGNRVGGEFAGRFGSGCLATARLLGFPLLELSFTIENGAPALAAVEPFPSLAEPWAVSLTSALLCSLARGDSS